SATTGSVPTRAGCRASGTVDGDEPASGTGRNTRAAAPARSDRSGCGRRRPGSRCGPATTTGGRPPPRTARAARSGSSPWCCTDRPRRRWGWAPPTPPTTPGWRAKGAPSARRGRAEDPRAPRRPRLHHAPLAPAVRPLPWAAMTDLHPNARRVADAARDLGLDIEVRTFPEGTKTAADAAAAIGVEVG